MRHKVRLQVSMTVPSDMSDKIARTLLEELLENGYADMQSEDADVVNHQLRKYGIDSIDVIDIDKVSIVAD